MSEEHDVVDTEEALPEGASVEDAVSEASPEPDVEGGVETAAVAEESAADAEEDRKAAIRRQFDRTGKENTVRKQALKEAHLK